MTTGVDENEIGKEHNDNLHDDDNDFDDENDVDDDNDHQRCFWAL